MEIVGLRIEKYIGKTVSGHNCNFRYNNSILEKHILCGILENNDKVEIELSKREGECCSGWTTASWGNIRVYDVLNFGGYTHIPKNKIVIYEDFIKILKKGIYKIKTNIKNDVFVLSTYGESGDEYYPEGFYTVNMELFEDTVRHKPLRPVWIFKGKSNSGKSYLSSRLEGLVVYETDSSENLPNIINASVIVLGNKYKYSIEDIKERIFGEAEVQIVDFQ